MKREQHANEQAIHDRIASLERENLRLKVAIKNMIRYLRSVGMVGAANALERSLNA